MEQIKEQTKNKRGRPKKAIKRDQVISFTCSSYEKTVIIGKAKSANISITDYMREVAMTSKINMHDKALPKEVLQLTGMLYHIAACLDMIAKKRNGIDELSALERANLKIQSDELKQLAVTIKSHLQ